METKQEIRCKKCNARLFDLEPGGVIIGQVIKCRKCGAINKFVEVKYQPNYETRVTTTQTIHFSFKE